MTWKIKPYTQKPLPPQPGSGYVPKAAKSVFEGSPAPSNRARRRLALKKKRPAL